MFECFVFIQFPDDSIYNSIKTVNQNMKMRNMHKECDGRTLECPSGLGNTELIRLILVYFSK